MKYLDVVHSGFGQIAGYTKMLLYKHDQELFDKIDFENDRAFTEPFIFSYFNSDLSVKPTLDQLLWHYFKDEKKTKPFELSTDSTGIAYIPEHGYLLTHCKEEKLTASFDGKLVLHKNGAEVNYKFESIQKVGDINLSLFTYPSSLLNPFFRDSEGKQVQVTLLKNEWHIGHFQRALKIIKNLNEEYYDAILATVRGISSLYIASLWIILPS